MSKEYWQRFTCEEREMLKTALIIYISWTKMPENIEKKWQKLINKINY